MAKQRMTRRRWLQLTGISIAAMGLAACGDGGSDAPTPAPNAPAAGSGGEIALEVNSAGEDSRYDKERLEAPAGAKITLTFTNRSTGSKLFNWVLTQPERFLQVVNDGSAESEANGFLKPNDANVIAHTKLLKAGESDTITFDAPAPGEYPYICTTPGYFARMKGVLVVSRYKRWTPPQRWSPSLVLFYARSEPGSSASRSPSPKNEKPSTSSESVTVGRIAIYK
ncbi:MAG: hypothetical protein HC853_07190 [Anaerolineae bacterium]|nr:hypothetical protein [Anaerolineae bacterium]